MYHLLSHLFQPMISEVEIPANASVSGTCSYDGTNNTQQLILTFFDNWTFEVIIGLEAKETQYARRRLLENTEGYGWKEVQLKYTLDEHFEDPVGKGKCIALDSCNVLGFYQKKPVSRANV